MSKPFPQDGSFVQLEPTAQVHYFADLYRATLDPIARARFAAHVRDLGLDFTADERLVFAALDTPDRVQHFLNTQIYYNDDHNIPNVEETAMPPRRVLQTARAHCFEGALFAYAVNYLHGHEPRMVLLEASQDPDHNLVIHQDKRTGLYGANAHSGWEHLDGRPAQYPTIRALVESYVPYYISDLTKDPNDRTLVGYSDPFDLVTKFGFEWMGSEEPLWQMYYTYVDDTIRFHYLSDDSGEPHLYPLIRALRENWIQRNGHGEAIVLVENLPLAAQELWHAFWGTFDPAMGHPRGRAREIEKEFMRLTGMTPIDLRVQAGEFKNYLATGHRLEQIITQR